MLSEHAHIYFLLTGTSNQDGSHIVYTPLLQAGDAVLSDDFMGKISYFAIKMGSIETFIWLIIDENGESF